MAADSLFELIAITPEEPFEGEAGRIAELLNEGFGRVHIRHPKATCAQIEEILTGIPPQLRSHISLHDHFELALKHRPGGVHLNSRCPHPPERWTGLVSRSCHSIAEVESCRYLDYVTLSPVYDSLSKPGYKGVQFGRLPMGVKIIALGGVTPDKFHELQSLGYAGAALLTAADWYSKHNN